MAFRRFSAAAMLTGISMAMGPVAPRADTMLEFCYDPYPPYTISTDGVVEGGSKVALLDAVMERIEGLDARVVLLPWKRCQAEAKHGRVDGILPLFINEERETYLAFSGAVFQEQTRFWYNRQRFIGGLKWEKSVDELSGLKFAMLNGGYIDAQMERAFEANQGIMRVRDVKALMLLLLSGRVDLIATDSSVGAYTVRQNGWQDTIAAVDHVLTSRSSHFGLSKAAGADRYLGAINDALDALHADGTVAALYADADARP